MKNKIFSLMAVVLFVGSSLNLNAMNTNATNTLSNMEDERDCIGFVLLVEEIMGCELDYEDFAALYDKCEALQ